MKIFYSSFIANFFGFDFILPGLIFFRHSKARMDIIEELYPIVTRLRIIRKVGARHYYFTMILYFLTNCFREVPIQPYKHLERKYYSQISLTHEENSIFLY